MARVHDLVPVGLAERQDPAGAPRIVRRENGHVNLDLAVPGRVGDDAGRDLARHRAERIIPGQRQRPLPADGLEVRADHLGQEGGLGVAPRSRGVASFQPGPFPAHDGLIEDNQRLGDPVQRPALPERFCHAA